MEEDRVTSFRELFEQAASLALRFVEHGIHRQDRIALVLPKTTEAIVSVFASLLAGAIYVPIHPQWPKERIETTLADCAARLVIEARRGREVPAANHRSRDRREHPLAGAGCSHRHCSRY